MNPINNPSRFAWFTYGMIAAGLLHLILGTTPEEAKENIKAWTQIYDNKR